MTREDIIRELGWTKNTDPQSSDLLARIERIVEKAVAAEREACAKVCDEKARNDFPWASENTDIYTAQADWAAVCAKAIRARGEK